jgi:AraC family transcriptional regulator
MSSRRAGIDYHERLGRVIAYIHDHLEEELRLEQLAEVAHLSPYHWHRVYHALHGETIANTIRRLRLQRGSGYLANSEMPVAHVARRCGYPNVQSFARAFHAAYGMSPSRYRADGGHALFRGSPMQPEAAGYVVEVRDVPITQVAGMNHQGSYMRIGKAFEQAYSSAAKQGLVWKGMRWLAVYDDDPFAVPEAQLRARAGFSLQPMTVASPPLMTFTIGGCACARLRHRGPYATMRASYEWLYGHWLVRSGRESANAPAFEEYLNNPRDTAPADLLTDIFLPLLGGTAP